MVNTPAETMTQFRVVELGQNAPPERRIVDVMKNVDCLGDPADFRKCTSQPGGNLEEQTARPAPSGQKLRIRLGVTRPGDRIDLGHRGYKIVTGKPLEQGFAPLIERQCVFFKNKLGHVTQQKCGNVEIAQTPQPGLLVGSFSVLDEVGDQRLGQLGGVILRCGFERMEQRCHGCCSARLLKGGNRGWLSST